MSRSANPFLPNEESRQSDRGFTLLEVIVALGVMSIVVVALLPQLVVAIRSTGTARLVTQAKGVAQGHLERMRNLPYHISPAAGDHRDVLDFYYRNLSPPSVTPACENADGFVTPDEASWSGYVSATSSARCSYEPGVGAFYRRVEKLSPADGIGSFTIVADTQFLSGATPPQPVTPRVGYDTRSIGKDRPPSSQIGVTVTVLYNDRETVRPVSSYTQISEQPGTATRVRVEANATALEVGSVTSTNGPVSLASGLLNLSGSLTYASTVNANLAGTSAGLATGEQASGASATLAAPPTAAAATKTGAAGALTSSGCDLICWGGTRVEISTLSAEQALPNAGSAEAPMQALLTDAVNNGVSFANSPPSTYRPGLQLTPPLLRVDPNASPVPTGTSPGCGPGSVGVSSYVAASGYVRTTGEDSQIDPSTVDACAVARTSTISIFPTEFAPRGVVLVELHRAVARCLVQGAAHTVAPPFYDYQAVVKVWDGTGYQSAATVTPMTTTDPLEGIDLATTSVGGTKVLGDYIASWSSLTAGKVGKTQAPGLTKVQLPGIITIGSQPVRQDATVPGGDPASVLSVTIGALGCTAEDRR